MSSVCVTTTTTTLTITTSTVTTSLGAGVAITSTLLDRILTSTSSATEIAADASSALTPAATPANVRFSVASINEDSLDSHDGILQLNAELMTFSSEDDKQTSGAASAPSRKKISGAQQRKRAKLAKQLKAISGNTEAGPSQANQGRTDSQTMEGNNKKRARSSETTPPARPPLKIAKTPATENFRQPEESRVSRTSKTNHKPGAKRTQKVGTSVHGIRMVIVLNDGVCGRIPTVTLRTLDDCIARAIDSGTGAPETVEPRLESSRITDGRYYINCYNSESVGWLKDQVDRPEFCSGAVLTLVEPSRVPRMRKSTVHIPGVPEEFAVVCRRLKLQNRVLDTENWTLFGEKNTASGQLLTIGMDEESVTALRSIECAPFYRIGRIYFRVTNQTNDDA